MEKAKGGFNIVKIDANQKDYSAEILKIEN